ncbi:MAG: peptidoglycan-binding protein [Proteobacteria bacterium]|nr:peptidoglycan-binding protein [Pseudomonadota bacterium]
MTTTTGTTRARHTSLMLPAFLRARGTSMATMWSGRSTWRLCSATGAQTPATQAYNLTIIQAALAAKGYDPGPIDGKMGAKTRAAIRRYQSATGFEITGNPSAALQRSLTGG